MEQLNKIAANKQWLVLVAIVGILAGLWGTYGSDRMADARLATQEVNDQPAYFDLQPLVVNIASGTGRNRFLRIRPTLEVRRAAYVDSLNQHEPLIRNTLLSLYSQTHPADLLDDQGFDHLREASLSTLQDVLLEKTGEHLLSGVLFTEYVIQ